MLFYVVFVLHIFVRVSCTLRLNSLIGLNSVLNLSTRGKYNHISNQNAIGASTSFMSRYNILFREMNFVQKLDHSRPSGPIDDSQWIQRSFANHFYYEEGGPVFLFVFGEAIASDEWMDRGFQWTEYAKKLNAMCFGLEHRFYGKSRPTKNTNITNLQYLTSEQALGDIAYFIESMNKQCRFPPDTKWIVFGGSYAGTLAAWARMKYPHLVHGAVASSAPLLAKTDFFEYYQVVERSLRKYSPKCAENVAIANRHLKHIVRTRSGRAHVSKLFKLCSALTDDAREIAYFFEILAINFALAVQYDGKVVSISEVCYHMNDDEIAPLQRYANVNNHYSKLFGKFCTSTNYTEIVNDLRNDNYDGDYNQQSSRLWTYQTCAEFGFHQTSRKPTDLFGEHFPVDFVIKILCTDVFGSRFNKAFVDSAVDRTNMEFGGLKYNTSNVIFINGDVDPWHALGITNKTKSAAYEVVFIPGSSHCNDMFPSHDSDDEHVKAARRKIFEVLKSWLVEEDISSDNLNAEPQKVKFQINGEDQNVAVRAKVKSH